ncbi:2,6-dihydroxypseudooxynicotine hydrolase [Streptosporangium subroseum]|uniref:2,6-dihydroxypseudooxynicotine hydrolase n=1 Tax=Streptosporangium subroseum TaxID=106412 RepID=A0A239EKK8_9ACTN|nr:alpha/beta hydrolase [Streptosporangium subroseum]SNS45185.1 2,6-dihydroxypseudooxynicotine hydrolase [Streptosporangium subroseum]
MDELVASAVSHWAPRFTTNGVAVADFERVTSGLKDWDGWCSAWSEVGAEHEALGAEAVREGRLRSAGQHYVQAAVCYHFGKFLFVQDPDQMREAHLAAVRCLDAALPHLDPPGRRIEIPFDGSRLVGVLRLPHGPGPHPLTVMVPGLDSAKEEFRSTEALFLERGVGTFSVDGPGQGEAEYDLAIRGDWEVPGAAILDAVSAEPDVDPDRLGVWGVSLGGYYAPRIAGGDSRVRACVALAGPYDFGEGWGELPALTRAAFRARSRAESDEHAREIAHTLSLKGRTASITCPLLVVTGRRDRLIPWQHAARLAEEAGGETRLLLLDEGNHGCMNVAAQHRQKTADWMAAQLGAGE